MNIKKWLGLLGAVAISAQPIYAQAPPPPEGIAAEVPGPGKPEAAPAVEVNVSAATAEVVRLAESGLGDGVVMAYVTNSQTAFSLTAEDIVYLKDVGISEDVITSMMSHDKMIRESGPPPRSARQPAPPPQVAPQEEPPVVTPPPVYVSNAPQEVNYFYSDLAPYGTWLELDGVGWCWQPRVVVVNRDWRPYCDYGRWVYSDCGWYWSSSYSWGWAPFHYGRWENHPRCGWVWTPDRVWGPAWVSWRVAGDHCGWAPLPPFAVFDGGHGWRYRGSSVSVSFDFGLRPDHFTFVAFRDFGSRDLGHYRLPRSEVTRVYNNTTIINNYTVNRNTIVNHGVSVDRVSAESRTPIRRASLRDLPADSGSRSRGGLASRPSEGRNVVYRRELPSTPPPAPKVVAQRVDASHPVVRPAPITPVRNETRRGTTSVSRNNGSTVNPAVDTTRTRRGNIDTVPSTTTTPSERRGSTRDVTPTNRRNDSTPATPAERRATSRETTPTPTPPSTIDRRSNSRDREDAAPTPRAVERPIVTPPSTPAPSRSAPGGREYQQVPRTSRGNEDSPAYSQPRSSPPSENRREAPQYVPKGSAQASESRSQPRYESRSSSPSQRPSSRSGDDNRDSGGRRDRDR